MSKLVCMDVVYVVDQQFVLCLKNHIWSKAFKSWCVSV